MVECSCNVHVMFDLYEGSVYRQNVYSGNGCTSITTVIPLLAIFTVLNNYVFRAGNEYSSSDDQNA